MNDFELSEFFNADINLFVFRIVYGKSFKIFTTKFVK